MLTQRLSEYIAAAFTGIWIQSFEHEDALAEIAKLCRQHKWSLAVWDVDRGLQAGDASPQGAGTSDPVAAIKSINALAKEDSSALLTLPNFHRFMGSAEIVQALAHQIHQGKQNRTFVVILSPLVQIPLELERQFVVIEHELPSRPQLQEIAAGIATDPGEMPDGEQLVRLLDAASGLSRFEAEGAFSLSLVRNGRLDPAAVWELKTQSLQKSGLLSLHRGQETFDDLGGLEAMKAFCLKALRTREAGDGVTPRGILLLGVPGTGKSAFAKALGNQTGRPTLVLDVGALMGSLVGQTEQNIRSALRIADAMAPCIIFADEVEKALAGAASSGVTDSGVSARLFGSLLTWMSDHESDVFVVTTSNNISALPPEFSRAERFDAVYFLDLPSEAERQSIWKIYQAKFAIPDQPLPEDNNWTGAEIRSCCRLASLLGVSLADAARNVVPVAATAAETIERLRTWACGRCLSANSPGLYTRSRSAAATQVKRRVSRPIDN
jgi:hypothetical protein